MIKSSNTKKNILIMGHLLIVILIISTFLLNNPFFFTLLELKREFAEDTTKGYSFFDNNPVYIEFVDENFRPALIINDDDANKLYSNLLKLEKYDVSRTF